MGVPEPWWSFVRVVLVGLMVAGMAVMGTRLSNVPPAPALLSASSATPIAAATSTTTRDTLAEASRIQRMLDDAATAFRTGDVGRLRGHLYDPDSLFGRRWLRRVKNMQTLPLKRYELSVAATRELSTPRVRRRYDTDTQVVDVTEGLVLDGFDDRPVTGHLYLTLVQTTEGWKVASDSDAESYGFVSDDHLFDHGPVTVVRRGSVLILSHPDGPDLATLGSEILAARSAAMQRWPLAWSGRVVVVVPRDEDELAELLHATFNLSNYLAFTTSRPVQEGESFTLSGARVVVNPTRFLHGSRATRGATLVHELVHVASRAAAGPSMPSWLEEGVAQAIGERGPATGTALLDATARRNRRLPTDDQFTADDGQRISLSYQLAWNFVDQLLDTYGPTKVAAFYRAVGQGSVGRPGTQRVHLDTAARAVFGTSMASLVAAWRTDAS